MPSPVPCGKCSTRPPGRCRTRLGADHDPTSPRETPRQFNGSPAGLGHRAKLQNNEWPLTLSRALGAGAPLAPRLAGANLVNTPVPPTTHRLPSSSKARPIGMLREPALEEITTCGANGPLPANWSGVNATTLLLPLLTTHRFPAASKARPVGFTSESAAVRTNAGGGD